MRKIYDRICYQDDDNAISGVLDDTVQSGEEENNGEIGTTGEESGKVEDAQQQHEKDGTWPENTPQWVKDRVNKTTRQKYELKSETERLRAELETANKKLQEKTISEIGAAPSRENFEDEDSYIDARSEWNYNRLRAKERTGERARDASNRQALESQTFNEKVSGLMTAGSGKYDNFADVVTSVPGDLFRQEVVEAITASGIENKNSEDVAWFLAHNLDQAERISKLDPLSRAAALGVISTRLSLPTQKRTTKTPEPIKKGNERGGATGEIPDDIDGIASIINRNRGKG